MLPFPTHIPQQQNNGNSTPLIYGVMMYAHEPKYVNITLGTVKYLLLPASAPVSKVFPWGSIV